MEEQKRPNGEFMIDGKHLSQVKVIGCITNVQEAATNTIYELEDGTGRLNAKFWNNQEEDAYADSDNRAQITYVLI